MTAGKIVSLRSRHSCAALNSTRASVETLWACVCCRCAKTSQRTLRVEWLSTGEWVTSAKATRSMVLIVSVCICCSLALSKSKVTLEMSHQLGNKFKSMTWFVKLLLKREASSMLYMLSRLVIAGISNLIKRDNLLSSCFSRNSRSRMTKCLNVESCCGQLCRVRPSTEFNASSLCFKRPLLQ